MDERTKELLSEGVKSFREGDFESAKQSFKQALELEPENALIHNNYAMMLKRTERYDQAEKHFRTALDLEPENVQIQKNYGNLLKAKNAADESEENNQSP